jgi:hypothetical protein
MKITFTGFGRAFRLPPPLPGDAAQAAMLRRVGRPRRRLPTASLSAALPLDSNPQSARLDAS